MKKSMLNIAIAALFLPALFFACGKVEDSARDKANEAKEEVREAQQDVEAARDIEERKAYKANILERIARNEERIAQLREKKKSSGKGMDEMYQMRIETLEKRNAELKEKINNYEGSDKAKWEEFKREFNHDMDELGKSIKELGEDNVK